MGFDFDKKLAEFKRLKSSFPKVVGNMAKRHFVKSFRDQGFTDETLDPWAARKTKNKSDRRNPARRAILVNRGHLRRSIKVGRASFNRIEVGSYGIKYAKYHNKGTDKHPQRQFVGSSRRLNRAIQKRMRNEVIKVLK